MCEDFVRQGVVEAGFDAGATARKAYFTAWGRSPKWPKSILFIAWAHSKGGEFRQQGVTEVVVHHAFQCFQVAAFKLQRGTPGF